MADVEININSNGSEEVGKTVNALTKLKTTLKETRAQLLTLDEGSKEFKKLSKEAAALQDKMDDLNDATKNFKGTGIEKLSQSFNLLKESFTNFDGQKAGLGFKVLGSAMKAIPIFFILEGVKYLIENFEKLSQGSGFLGKALRFVGDIIKTIVDAVYALTDALGLTNSQLDKQGEAITKNAEKAKDAIARQSAEYDNQINAAKAAGKSTIDLEIAKQQAIIETNKALVEQTIAYVKAGGKLTEEQNKLLTEQITAIKTARATQDVIEIQDNKQKTERYKEHLAELQKLQVENMAEGRAKENALELLAFNEKVSKAKGNAAIIEQLEIQHQQNLYNIKSKYDAIDSAKLKQKEEDEKRSLDAIEAYFVNEKESEKAKEAEIVDAKKAAEAEKLNASLLAIKAEQDARAKAKAETEAAIKEGVETINKYGQASITVTNNIYGAVKAIADLREQTRQQELAEQAANAEASIASLEAQKDAELAKEGLTAQQKVDIQNKFAQAEYQIKLAQYNRETEVKKKSFEQDKKFRIVQTVISTITGSVAALTSALQSLPYPAGLIAGLISASAVSVMGAVQIAQISKQKFDAGSPPSPPTVAAAGSDGGGSTGNSSLNKATLFSTGQSQATSITPFSSNAQQVAPEPQVVKAVVVEQDITDKQALAASIKNKTTIG
jgi:hypothetical protein